MKKATFAGGCFWCMEYAFSKIQGIVDIKVGYANCRIRNPNYESVSKGNTGCYEAVQITYDENKLSYETLLDVFWHNINPEDDEGQFSDKGEQYRTAIFWHSQEQRQKAIESKNALLKKGIFNEIRTKIIKFKNFYIAEDYHQAYYRKNPIRFFVYESLSGRKAFIEKVWGKH
ncbi:MAG: peptide-methionine (S)-S-oxide reductase MsrA [Candidatus Anstonellales archaeon]